MIDKGTVAKILDAADIVDVVSDYVHLTKRGSNYMGLCPFHNEKTPSFSVNRARNICHCFSCGKGGSPVNFIMEKEGINYHDALIHLAGKYGIKVQERELTDEERQLQSERESMMIANEWAMKLMQQNLAATDEGRNVGLQYLYQRGVTDEAIKAFRLGYALDAPAALYNAAKKEGFETDVLRAVGLCGLSQQSGRPYDRFRGRVIFPVLNSAGKVIAFGGRGIKGEPAKYINSPESALYVKSNELYGIHQARNAIVRMGKCFLVEGYMDVIGMWQSGIQNVVASSGTSLTEGQIALLHRFTENVTLIYDGDAAGIKASMRGIDLLLSQKLNIKVLLLPDGDDPDSFARKHTPEEFNRFIEEHETDFIRFKTDILLKDANEPLQRAQAIKSIVRSIASVSDMIQRTVFIQQCAIKLGMSEQVLLTEVNASRVEVMDELRKRRELTRLERERSRLEREGSRTPQPPANVTQDQQQPPHPVNQAVADAVSATVTSGTPGTSQAAGGSPAAASGPNGNSSETLTASELSRYSRQENEKERVLRPLEERLAAYCIKYGLVDFCTAIDEQEQVVSISVLDYIREEMEADRVEFTTDLVRKVVARTSRLAEEYAAPYAQKLSEIDEAQQKRREQWRSDIATRYMSVQELSSKEQEFEEQLDLEKRSSVKEFAMEYSARTLCSDPDDAIREFALKAVIPRFHLSSYHSKQKKVLMEADKLEELIPRAISELKDGLLLLQFKDEQRLLGEAAERGDSAATERSMRKLQHISELRSAIAKTIGERIVTPRR